MIRNVHQWLIVAALILSIGAADGFGGTASAAAVTEGRIRDIVRTYIEKNMPWGPDALRLEFPMKLADQEFKGNRITWQVQGRMNEEFIGDSIFTVRFYDQEVFAREVSVRVRMEVAMDVVVGAKALTRDAVLGPADVKVLRKWYHRTPPNILTDPEEAIGKSLVTAVRLNGEITPAMLKTPRMIRKGSLVKILAQNDSIVISTIGLSEDNGSRGDIIRVKNLSSNKIVYAKIIDQAMVRVDF